MMNKLRLFLEQDHMKLRMLRVTEFIFRYGLISKKIFIKLQYRIRMNCKCNLKHPTTLSEKLQWLKLYDVNPTYNRIADKIKFKEYIREKIGEEYVVPTLGVYDDISDINFDTLPDNYVVKCNHGSKFTYLVDKNVSRMVLIKKLKKALKKNYYYHAAEYPYKDIDRKIIIEPFISDDTSMTAPVDYKIFCLNGSPELIEIDHDRYTFHKRDIYDIEFNKLDVSIKYPVSDIYASISASKLKKLLDIATALSRDIIFVRVDCYIIKDNIYVGEMTFFPDAGFLNFEPKDYDRKLGSLLNINSK